MVDDDVYLFLKLKIFEKSVSFCFVNYMTDFDNCSLLAILTTSPFGAIIANFVRGPCKNFTLPRIFTLRSTTTTADLLTQLFEHEASVWEAVGKWLDF